MDQRLLKKPKYKIGDIVVYADRYVEEDDMQKTYQSKIISANGLLEAKDPEDLLGWYYETEHTKEELEDNLTEDDILYQL